MPVSALALAMMSPAADWSTSSDPTVCVVNSVAGLAGMPQGKTGGPLDQYGIRQDPDGTFFEREEFATGDESGICIYEGGTFGFVFSLDADGRFFGGELTVDVGNEPPPFGLLILNLDVDHGGGSYSMTLMGSKPMGWDQSGISQEISPNRVRFCPDLPPPDDGGQPAAQFCVLLYKYEDGSRTVNGKTPLFVLEIGNPLASN